MTWVRCPDQAPHKPHWYTIRSAGITFAGGRCDGELRKGWDGALVDVHGIDWGPPEPRQGLRLGGWNHTENVCGCKSCGPAMQSLANVLDAALTAPSPEANP